MIFFRSAAELLRKIKKADHKYFSRNFPELSPEINSCDFFHDSQFSMEKAFEKIWKQW